MKRTAKLRRSTSMLSIVLAGCLMAPDSSLAQQRPHHKASESVVEIKCPIMVDGERKVSRATGFAWGQPNYVVTALHVVVGCLEAPRVHSETIGDGSPAKVAISFLEADLALLQLERDIGLPVVEHATSLPDIERRFYLYGYPLYARKMNGGPIDFKWGGRGEGVTSLKEAFRSDDLKALFRSQSYPAPHTKIFPIQSPIVSGYSGSPIFDEEGRVVAIVDGALLNGTVGANWSVPAHYYLPKLLDSEDRLPGEASAWAKELLKSSVSDEELSDAPADLSPMANVDGDQAWGEADAAINLNLARKVTLARLAEGLDDYQLDSYATNRNNLEIFIGDAAAVDAVQFYIYEEIMTGATFGLPAEFYPSWNEAGQVFQVATDSGDVVLKAAIERWGSFDEAIADGKESFADFIAQLGHWDNGKSPADFELVNCVTDERTGACDPSWLWRQNSDIYTGTDPVTGERVELTLSITVSDSDLLALAIYNYGDFNDDLTEADKISYLKLQTGLNLLTDFSRH